MLEHAFAPQQVVPEPVRRVAEDDVGIEVRHVPEAARQLVVELAAAPQHEARATTITGYPSMPPLRAPEIDTGSATSAKSSRTAFIWPPASFEAKGAGSRALVRKRSP
jgi:hypothetical protein